MEGHGLAVTHEQVLIGRHRRDLAAVIGLDLAALCMQQEGTTTDAARLGLDQAQHQLHRNGCIDRRAPGLQHLVAGIGGQGVGSSYRVLLGGPAGFVGPAGAAFGLVRCGRGLVLQLGLAAAGGQQRCRCHCCQRQRPAAGRRAGWQ